MSAVDVSLAMGGNLARWGWVKLGMLAGDASAGTKRTREHAAAPRRRVISVTSRETAMHVRAIVVSAALVATLAVAPPARPDGGEDGTSTDDLLCVFRPYYVPSQMYGGKWTKGTADVPWTDWWYANRRDLLKPTYRA